MTIVPSHDDRFEALESRLAAIESTERHAAAREALEKELEKYTKEQLYTMAAQANTESATYKSQLEQAAIRETNLATKIQHYDEILQKLEITHLTPEEMT